MAVSKSLRHQVMRRDSHTCRYCGAHAPDVKLTIDHVTPVTLGGQDIPENLVTACADCNAGKSSSPPDASLVADVDQRAVEWGQAMQVAVEQRAAELAAERGRTDTFDQEWRRWNAGDREVWRDQNWRASVLRLLAAGLTDEFLIDAVGIAMRSKVKAADTWRYFCGVCWREVDKIQGIARRIAGDERDDLIEQDMNYVMSPAEEAEWHAEQKQHREDFAVKEAYLAVLRAVMDKLGASEELLHEMGRVVVASREASITYHDYGVPNDERMEKAYVDLEQYVTAALASLRFPAPIREPQIDYMAMFDRFLDHLVPALGGDAQIRKLVDQCLWMAMPEAHKAWQAELKTPGPDFDPEEDDVADWATDRGADMLSDWIAHDMHGIAQWRVAKDHSLGGSV